MAILMVAVVACTNPELDAEFVEVEIRDLQRSPVDTTANRLPQAKLVGGTDPVLLLRLGESSQCPTVPEFMLAHDGTLIVYLDAHSAADDGTGPSPTLPAVCSQDFVPVEIRVAVETLPSEIDRIALVGDTHAAGNLLRGEFTILSEVD